MPDISMCAHQTCGKRTTCYRHEESGTKPCEWRQSYMLFGEEHDTENCEHYWEK